MDTPVHTILNAFMFRNGLACPLRYNYLRGEESMQDTERWKRDVKRVLERVLCLELAGECKPEGSYRSQMSGTIEWLERSGREPIFGGRLMDGPVSVRYPAMTRQGDRVILSQVHGRLIRGLSAGRLDPAAWREPRWSHYLMESALRVWMLRQFDSDLEIGVNLVFPSSRFRAGSDQLFESVAAGTASRSEIEGLTVSFDASRAVDHLLESAIDLDTIHPELRGERFGEIIRRLIAFLTGEKERTFHVTDACKACRFRQAGRDEEGPGCWQTHLTASGGEPFFHTYDLIGSGNGTDIDNGYYLQRQIPLGGTDRFADLPSRRKPRISLADRRRMQLLRAHGREVPVEWIRSGLFRQLDRYEPPYHFIDFEAASSALPLLARDRPYRTFLFQFSCHTMHGDGSIDRTEWLAPSHGDLGRSRFAEAFLSIPGIGTGSLIHYSPFEKQALETLKKQLLDSDALSDQKTGEALEQCIEKAKGAAVAPRFLDIGQLVHDYYYNERMSGGLGLKELIRSLVAIRPDWKQEFVEEMPGTGRPGEEDPFAHAGPVSDGPAAMYAWLYSRMPTCREAVRKEIRSALGRYCRLDTFSLLVLFRHWLSVGRELSDGRDYLFQGPDSF